MSSRPANNFTCVTYKGALNIATLSTLSYSSNLILTNHLLAARLIQTGGPAAAKPALKHVSNTAKMVSWGRLWKLQVKHQMQEDPTLGVTTIRPRNLWLWLPLDLFFRTKKTRIDMGIYWMAVRIKLMDPKPAKICTISAIFFPWRNGWRNWIPYL